MGVTAPAGVRRRHPIGDRRLDRAVILLGELGAGKVSVADVMPIGGEWAPATRLVLTREIDGIGQSVIVKTRRVENDGHGGFAHLRREQAGLLLAAASGITPRLVAADQRAGIVVMTDMGDSPSLESVLLTGGAATAADAFVAYAAAMARLHTTTIGTRQQHAEALATLGGDAWADRLGLFPGADRWDRVESLLCELDLPRSAAAGDDIRSVLARLHEPEMFGALVHGDLTPTNALVTETGVVFVDFEGATFGHIGTDVSCIHLPFGNYSAHWATIPSDVVANADAVYRDALLSALPSDAAAHYDDMVVTGVAALVAIRLQRLPRIAEAAQSARDSWRRRAQMAQQLDVLAAVTAGTGLLTALGTWAHDLADAMRDRWPDAGHPPAPVFPAFVPK